VHRLATLRPWPRIPSSRPQMSSRSMQTARYAPASCLPCCLPASGPINGATSAALLCRNPPSPHEISCVNKPGKDAFHRVPIRLLPFGRTRRTIFAPFLHRFCTILRDSKITILAHERLTLHVREHGAIHRFTGSPKHRLSPAFQGFSRVFKGYQELIFHALRHVKNHHFSHMTGQSKIAQRNYW
jgi:hypothetical protein